MKKQTKVLAALSATFLSALMLSATVSAHDNGVAKTPPMGWSSWNTFRQNIDEDLIMETADAMVKYGLRDAGYEFVNLDDNWHASERTVDGRLTSDPVRFPSGIKALADYAHDNSLKLGLYTSNGLFTCEDLPGSEFKEKSDAASFAEWGIDYFKYDYCHHVQLSTKAYGINFIRIAKPYEKGTDIYTYQAREAALEGTARLVDNSYITGLGNNAGFATFTVTVPEDGEYALDLNYRKENSDEEVPMFLDINGDSVHPIRMMLPPKSSWSGFGRATATLELKKGENTLRFYNPIRTSNRDYDSARYTYGVMRDALMDATKAQAEKTGEPERPITFGICEWGGRQPWIWGPQTGNLWRTTGDINASWSSIMGIYDVNVALYPYAGPDKGWNDPDMLEVGNGSLTHDENVSHFSLWCMMASPLVLGNDLRLLEDKEEVLEIITNRDAIAVDQDTRGVQGIKFRDDGDLEYLVKPLNDGKVALLMFNRGSSAAEMSVQLSEIGDMVKAKDQDYYDEHFDMTPAFIYNVKDVWEKDENGNNVTYDAVSVKETVPSHGSKMYIIEPTSTKRGAYLLGSISKTTLKAGQKAIVTAKFANGGSMEIRTVGLYLDLPEGFLAKPLTSTTSSFMKTGDSITVQWEITVPEGAAEDLPIDIIADLLYTGDKEISSVNNELRVDVVDNSGLTPLEDGPLTIHNWISGVSGWKTPQQDKGVGGGALTINGTTYETGIGTHAPSEFVYYIGGRDITFTSLIGIDDGAGGYRNGVIFKVYGDDDLLYSSGVIEYQKDPKSVEVDLSGYDYLKLVVDHREDDWFDHSDWINPQIKATEGRKYTEGALTTKNWMSGESFWKNPQDGKNIDGGALVLGGQEYTGPEDGFGVNAPSTITYYVGGAPMVFTAKIGIGDEVKEALETKAGGTVVYQVWGDDDLLYEKFFDANTPVEDLNVPLIGYDVLKLVVTDADDGTAYDHASWVQPRLTISSEPLNGLIEDAQQLLDTTAEGELNGQTPAGAFEEFQAAIDAAREAADKTDATLEEIAAAANALREAAEQFKGAKVVVDKYELALWIMKAEILDETQYPAEKWQKLEAVLEASWQVFTTEAVSQQQVSDAAAALQKAIDALAESVPGDVDSDGQLTMNDLNMIKDFVSGKIAFTPEQIELADFDKNGVVNVIDLLQWKLQLAGK